MLTGRRRTPAANRSRARLQPPRRASRSAHPNGAIDTARVSAAYRGYIGLDQRLADVVAVAIGTARDEAQHTASSERASYLTWALGIAALAVASLVFALWLARSSSQPLKALSAYAR